MASWLFKSNRTKWFAWLGIAVLFILIVTASYKPYVEIKVNAPSTDANLEFYYNNGQETILDEIHRSQTFSLDKGESIYKIYVPQTKNLDALRVDFGNYADNLELCSITLKNSLFSVLEFSGKDISKAFSRVNQVYATKINEKGNFQLQQTGEGSWIYGERLLSSKIGTIDSDYSFLAFLAFYLFVSFILVVMARYLYKKKKQSVSEKENGLKDSISIFFVSLFFMFLAALFFDQVILFSLTKYIYLSGFHVLEAYFKPMLTFSWMRIYFWSIWIALVFSIYILGIEKSVKYRYVIAGILLVLLVLGKFNTSSIGAFDSMLHGNTTEYVPSVLFGRPQGIRADEWAIEKPYYFAQAMNGLPYYNQNLAVGGADMVVYAFAPVANPMILARPDLWGFLFLPVEYAFSFYWFSKIIALFMGAFELFRVLVPQSRNAGWCAVAFTFSPVNQWFLSQGFIEAIIAGMFFVALWNQLLLRTTIGAKILAAIGCCLFANMYIYAMYPASQIPFGYIFLAMAIYVTWKNKDKHIFTFTNGGLLLLILCSIAGMAFLFLSMSSEALTVMSNTVYPGTVRTWSSIPWDYELLQLINPFTFLGTSTYLNNCETAQFFTLLPFSLIAVLLVGKSFKNLENEDKKSAIVLFVLTLVSLLLLFFEHLPQQNALTKAVFWGMSYPQRISFSAGFALFWVLQIAASILEKKEGHRVSTVWINSVVIFSGIVILIASMNSSYITSYFNSKGLIGQVLWIFTIVLTCILGAQLLYGGKYIKYFFAIYTVAVVCSTILVNPISSGVSSIYEKSLMTAVREINASEPGKWITSGNAGIGNLVAAQGVERRSGYYYYPDVKMMNIIDPDKKYINLWNSFTAVDMRLTTGENYIESPESNVAITVYINLATAKTLGIKYIVIQDSVKLPEQYLKDGTLKLCYDDTFDPWSIYKINYQ
jgi:hypothetical protein